MMKKMAVLTLCLFLMAPLVWAQTEADDKAAERKSLNRWYFSIGPYFTTLDSSVSLGVDKVGLGLTVDVEKLLGLDTETLTFRIDGSYRAGRSRRHRIDASWFSINRTGKNTILEPIELPPELGGGTILDGETVEGKFDIDIFKTAYRYSVILDDRIDFNVGGGLYIAPITFGIGLEGSDFAQTSLTAPLPFVGIGILAKLTEKWYAMAQADLMYLEIGSYEGGIRNSMVGVEWRPLKKVGFGLRAESLHLGVEVDEESDIPGLGDFVGDVKFGYVGASLYVSVFF